MSYKILNGYGTPIVICQHKDTKINAITIELDMCMIESGFDEQYQESFKRVELDYRGTLIDYNFKGCRITFNLDYGSYCSADNLMKIDQIHHYNSDRNYKLYLQPRSTASGGRSFEVRLSGDSWNQRLIKNTSDSVGHKDVKISFLTTHFVSKDFIDTNYTSRPSRYVHSEHLP